jgi:glycosyltransferase involved in cell wall biosynthesis
VEAELAYFRERYAVTLVSERIERTVPERVTAVEISAWGRFGSPNRALIELLSGFDLVHCHDSFGLMRAAHRSAPPVVVTSLGIAPPRIRSGPKAVLRGFAAELLYPRVYRSADAVVAISAYIGEWLRAFARIEPHVVLLGTEPPVRSTEPPRARNALYVGEVSRRKGLSDLLEGFTEGPRDVELDIVGRGDIERYANEARALGIEDRVRFHGVIPKIDLDRMFRSAHCTVTASLWEGFGLPILEGFRFGRPAVARRQGGMRELVELSGAGCTFDDPLEIGACLDKITSDWEELSRRALSFARTHTWDETFGAYAELFERLLTAT